MIKLKKYQDGLVEAAVVYSTTIQELGFSQILKYVIQSKHKEVSKAVAEAAPSNKMELLSIPGVIPILIEMIGLDSPLLYSKE